MSRFVLALCAVIFIAPSAFGGPIHDACKAGDLAQVQKLLDADKTLLESELNGWTPIQYAANEGRLEICRYLIERGASINHLDRAGNPALAQAASTGKVDVIRLLLEKGANPNHADGDGNSVLSWAVQGGSVDACKLLVEHGAKLDSKDKAGHTLLHEAAWCDSREVAKYLISKKVDLNAKSDFEVTPLAWAVERDRVEVARVLLKAGADIECRRTEDGNSMTPLLSVAKSGTVRCLRLLIESKAKVDAKDAHGTRALHYAAERGDVDMTNELLKNGADANKPNDDKWVPLHYSTNGRSLAVTEALVRAGAKVDARNNGGNTPLTHAALHNRLDQVNFLIKCGANVNSKGDRNESWHDNDALTVLHFAVYSKNPKVISALLDAGADPRVKAGTGQDAIAFAVEKGQTEIADLMSRKVGRSSTTVAAGSLSAPTFSLAAEQLVALGGLDTKAPPPLQLAPGGRMRVTARSSRIQAPPLAVVEFAPVVDRPDFEPLTYHFVVNGKEIDLRAVAPKAKALFSFDLPAKAGVLSRVQIVARDAKKTQVELLRAEVRTVDPAQLAPVKLELSGEKVVLENVPPKDKGVFLYAGTDYIGRLTDPKAFAVDARRVPAGQHDFYVVATNEYGDLLPAARSLIEIKPRYALSSPQSEGVFTVEGGEIAMPWTISCLQGAGIAKTRVYLRGTLVAESDKPSFEAKVPLSDVPSGQAILHIVGVAADGTLYASEARAFTVRNYYNDSLIARDNRAKTLQDMISQISQFDQQVAYWYSMAINEPAFRTYISGRTYYTVSEFGRMSSVGYLDTFTVPGRAEEYFARCKAAIVERAEFRLRIGKLQKLLGMRAQARSTLAQVIYEVGEGSGIGLAAAQEMAGL